MLVAPLMSSAKGRRCVTSSSIEHASLTLSPLARKRYVLVSATILPSTRLAHCEAHHSYSSMLAAVVWHGRDRSM